jgi:hypothetical protein
MKLFVLSIFIFSLIITMLFAFSHNAQAQSSLDLRGNVGGSGIPGGSIIPGFDSSACSGSNEGAIRYNDATSCAEFCDGTDWICPTTTTASENSTPPTNCPTIGNTCDDGSIYAGLTPDGEVMLYTTPADAGQFSWDNGTTTYVDTAMVNCTGAEASCDTGEANTALLVGLGTTPSPAPYVAARHCDNLTAHGHSDWYLPARYELAVLRTNRTAIGGFNLTGSLPVGWYWSSSERAFDGSWSQRFSDGSQYGELMGYVMSVLCVRR